MPQEQNEEELLRSVALQNAKTILLARERAEQESRDARQRLSSILESIGDGFFAIDKSWRFNYLNRKGEEILSSLRSSKNPLMGKNFWEEFPDVVGTDAEKNYRRAMNEQLPVGFESYSPALDKWFEIRAHPTPDGLSVYFHDITQRKRAEAAVREGAERLQLALAAGRLSDWSWDAATDLVTLGPGGLQAFGLPDGKPVSWKQIRELLHPDDREKTQKAVEDALASRNDYDTEYRVRHNGSFGWVAARGRGLYQPDGNPIGMVGVLQDITERKEGEEIRHRLAAVVESSDDAIICMSVEAIITAWNKGAERMFGYSPEEAIGKSVTMLIPQGFEDEEPMILARLLRGERIKHYETIRAQKDGTLLNVSLTVSPLHDATGKIIGASKISRDITERKRAEKVLVETNAKLHAAQAELKRHAEKLEEQVAERTAQLRETIQELEAFSYSISHDMRSPLRAMQGYSDALLEDYKGKLDETGENYLNRIRRVASRMDLLIQDVLAYSRVAKGEILLQKVNVETVIRDVIQNYPALQPERASITITGPLPIVLGHEAYLTQIVSNLLANAVKFVNPGNKPEVNIHADIEGDMVRISFDDSGIGIAPEHHAQIFQIFGRVYSEKKFEGTGIGLAIAKKAAERMSGSIGVTSQLGQGSKFFVLLKRAL